MSSLALRLGVGLVRACTVGYVLLLDLDAVNIQIPFLTVLMLRGPDFNFDSPNV
jgi:hypothetical protein